MTEKAGHVMDFPKSFLWGASTVSRQIEGARPIREFKAFQRLALEAGESRTLRLELGPERLRWSSTSRTCVQDVTSINIWVSGDGSAELAATLKVTP